MTIAAVICEYNPFHNGHKYQLDMIRKKLNADYIICIMSGDYVQRGEPAIFSKEIRTRWALENGADLVLQLPIAYATGSADLFATGAVSILNRLNCVDYLCFGSECGDIDTLCICAEKLLTEGQVGSEGIRALMKQGNTFAKSRYLLFPEFEMLLQYSNNVLALEYIMALMRTNSSIKPYTIKREGEDYDDATINSDEK
ncbi:MAG: nucleotidyltransferase family protein, partial [Lachnospiraceae bacterium]|nr:nucleotidyltransferase family protein [Lachnospiraceae bacterium]